ncbi:MAG TPA: dTDP-4-dehydrorhamnose 3,5-epimerase [bacterium]|jgi:dTDP-4-dehydrorhamnose 3,5-epimerase|nr:dTDP-4-dehydrorhamnose 3,5-epimerase [bacterium]
MRVEAMDIPGVLLITPDVFRDARGFFVETYHEARYQAAGVPDRFVQDNHSLSARGTLRGLHAQRSRPQAKLVRCVRGLIWDVAVDIRQGSPHFGRWVGAELGAESAAQIYVPKGFAHGFAVLSETAEVEYKCSDYYAPEDQFTIRWDDPEIGIAWPVTDPLLSDKDAKAPLLAAWAAQKFLPHFGA